MNHPSRADYIERGASVPSWAGGPSNPDLPESEGPRMKTFVVRGTFWAEVTAWESLEDAKHEWPAFQIEKEIALSLAPPPHVQSYRRTSLTWDFDDVQLDLQWMTQDESEALDGRAS